MATLYVFLMLSLTLLAVSFAQKPQSPVVCRHLVVLKMHAAGSTWFADTLNRIPGVSIIHQLLESTVHPKDDAEARSGLVKFANAPCARDIVLNGFTQRIHNISTYRKPVIHGASATSKCFVCHMDTQ